MGTPPFKVKSIYAYTSEHDDDLNFPVGEIISVLELEGDDWYVGEYVDESGRKREGIFPSNFVEKYEPGVPARPTRPVRARQEPAQVSAPKEQLPETEAADVAEEENDTYVAQPGLQPVASAGDPAGHDNGMAVPAPATAPEPSLTRADPPPAPKPITAEPVTSSAKVAPPPVAPKSNAFKDRIAAFNKVEAAPIKPLQPGRQMPAGGFIKKPFVAPPPSSTYVPPVTKQEPIHKPYVREEDPEIKLRQEQDIAAAEAAGLTSDGTATQGEGEEATPKPMSLKERMAMLQEQQRLQAERNMETAQRSKQPSAPVKKFSDSSDRGLSANTEINQPESMRSNEGPERKSLDAPRERPRIPSGQQQLVPPGPNIPEHEILSGGEEADQSAGGETTEEDDAETIGPADDDDEVAAPVLPRAPAAPMQEPDVGDQDDTAEDGEEDENEMDEEELRKQRLRERMARLAGPQGGAAPFNPFGAPLPPQPKKKATRDKPEDDITMSSSPPQNRIPIMPIPGMHKLQNTGPDLGGEQNEHEAPLPPSRRSMTGERAAAPPIPGGRPVPSPPSTDRNVPPPPPPTNDTRTAQRPAPQARPVPPPPQPASTPMSPGPGSESDDEMSIHARESLGDMHDEQTVLPIRNTSTAQEPSRTSEYKRVSTSYFAEPSSTASDKRASRVPPPVPGASGPMSPRPPPPPPPTAVPATRQSQEARAPATEILERGESDYEGDYDTDIASGASHKEALKAHARDSSLDDSTAPEDTPEGTPVLAPRAPPPPAPQGISKQNRPSMDAPRAPPPIPPPSGIPGPGDDDYDPYSYVSSTGVTSPPIPSVAAFSATNMPPPQAVQDDIDDSSADDAEPQKAAERAPPPPPHATALHERPAPMAPPHHATTQPETAVSNRSSVHLLRAPTGRASMDQSRSSFDVQGQIATDIDLSEHTSWWIASPALPPELQARNGQDVLTESEESTSSKRGGRTTITKDIYVLFMDYSQTHITAAYDAHDPSAVKLSQEHEPPAPKLRQDQLETYWQHFGVKIAEAAKSAGSGKKDSIVGDGSPYSLPYELIKAQPDALLPIGTRAFGALVYANLANASTMQFDEIRPGDILTVRNARFEGHHGAMRQKYKQDYGPSHVAIVEEWDGTRRAVRAFEQGREKKGGVRSEKFRLGDLRSGEVRVWRVVGRDWVNWQSAS